MEFRKGNIFDLKGHMHDPGTELFETILKLCDCRVERIVSSGQTSAEGEWYDQDRDEWVVLLQGNAVVELEDGTKHALGIGDFVFLPAHLRHRVAYTSTGPSCVWLALHGNLML